jgi:hypothetical protein
MAVAVRRLPGIEIDVAPHAAAEALPRMDVAVLVGFASSGPLHLPVVVGSVAQYAAVFGPDAPLAWDEARGERVVAYLGSAVRAFFANGGRRCWVVRVARSLASERVRLGAGVPLPATGLATVNRFPVAGVLELGEGGAVGAALAAARSEGSWSDGLRVATALTRQGFRVEGVATDAGSPPGLVVRFRTRHGLRVADLIAFADGAVTLYATVDSVEPAALPASPYSVAATVRAAFGRLGAGDSPALVERAGTASVAGVADSVAATLLPPGAATAAAGEPPAAAVARVRFDGALPAGVEPGQWVRWSDGGEPVWLRADAIGRSAVAPGGGGPLEEVTVAGPAWRELAPFPPAAGVVSAEVLALEVEVRGEENAARLAGLGLSPGHPAAWWSHRSDAELYRPADGGGAAPAAPEPAASTAPAERPRFPLCHVESVPGEEPRGEDEVRALPLAWLPVGCEPLFGAAPGPLPQPGTALERDGLARFDASLFLDPELAGASLRDLPELADAIRFLRARPRPLLGMHAALSVGAGGVFNEATLLGVPDAVHTGWRRRPAGAAPVPLPPADEPPYHWRTHRGGCLPAGAAGAGDAGAAADDLDEPDFGVFLDRGTERLPTPVLAGPTTSIAAGAFRLTWTPSVPGAEYALEEASRPDLADAREVYRGAATEHVPLARREGVHFYRVTAHRAGERSRASGVLAVRIRREAWEALDPRADPEAQEREWLTIHRAALRLGAAGGDLFAALAMPRHFRTQEAVRYAGRLRAVRRPPGGGDAGALGFSEAHALSHGALYFPWLRADARRPGGERPPAADAVPVLVPPDGAALGVLAARASERGAWVAPANEPIRDVVGVFPAVPRGDRQALQDAQVNLLRDDPRGFFALSADTLADHDALRPIGVRRLLTLLRRLALRRGSRWVFETNGPTLRRSVERGFEMLMTELYRRGAFAGATAAQSFRVVVDETVNTPRDADAGRLIVELRVAPSRPLAFLAVRLAQTGGRLSVTEEL